MNYNTIVSYPLCRIIFVRHNINKLIFSNVFEDIHDEIRGVISFNIEDNIVKL